MGTGSDLLKRTVYGLLGEIFWALGVNGAKDPTHVVPPEEPDLKRKPDWSTLFDPVRGE